MHKCNIVDFSPYDVDTKEFVSHQKYSYKSEKLTSLIKKSIYNIFNIFNSSSKYIEQLFNRISPTQASACRVSNLPFHSIERFT